MYIAVAKYVISVVCFRVMGSCLINPEDVKKLEYSHYRPGRLPRSVPLEAQRNLKSSSHFHEFHVAVFSVLFSSNYCRLSARPGAQWRQLYLSPGT